MPFGTDYSKELIVLIKTLIVFQNYTFTLLRSPLFF
jgi:hypothetical protein